MAEDEVLFYLFSDEVINALTTTLLLFLKIPLHITSNFILLCERQTHTRSVYEEEWIYRYLEYDFFLLFRMTKTTFYKLLEQVMCEELNRPYQGGENRPLSPEKALLMTLWWLGKGEVLNSVADHFDVVVSTVYLYTEIVTNRLVQLTPKYIRWPKPEELETVERQFEEICGFPGVVGAIDCCNINFKAPLEHQDRYIDKNDKHSIKLQAIVTATRIFININVGFPGSVHDSRVFRNSGVFVDIAENNNLGKYFPLESRAIPSGGRQSLSSVKLGINSNRDYGNMERHKRIYNQKHSQTRMRVECTFGCLKPRWRILYYINVNSVEKACKIISACCVLHNFCYLNLDEWDEMDMPQNNDDDEHIAIYIHNENIAIQKRDAISHLFLQN